MVVDLVAKRKPKNMINGIQVAREGFLKAKPLRHPESEWKKDEKGLHVKIPRKRTMLFRFFSKVLPLTRERRVLLDEQGAFIWSLCDGEHQVKDIAKKLSEQYNMRVSDAEAALDLYFVQLSKQSLIGFVLPESARKRYHKRFDADEKTAKKNTKQSEK
jgi:hypothetical protein